MKKTQELQALKVNPDLESCPFQRTPAVSGAMGGYAEPDQHVKEEEKEEYGDVVLPASPPPSAPPGFKDSEAVDTGEKEVVEKADEEVKAALPQQATGPLHSIQPGDWVVIKNLQRKHWRSERWQGPFQVLLTTHTAVKVAERATWIHAHHCKRVPNPTESTDRYNREVIVSGSLYMLWVFDGFLPGRVKDRLVANRYHQSFQSNKSSFRGKIKGLVTAMRSTAVTAGISCCFVLLLFSLNFLYSEEQWRTVVRPKIQITDSLNFGARENVETRTTWNAPIMWEGMFDPNLYDQRHIEGKSAVALTVFAVGRYLDAYLKTFLVSAEQHFMLGLPVTYYVFTDLPEKVPNVMLNAKRHLKIIQVQKYSRWQDISMMRMKMISEIIETDIRYHFSYVFCFDVDQEFKGRFGSEALGDSVALLHAHYYKLPKERFTYDRNPKSKAFMETGDFYYHAAIFGGLWENVKNLTDTCYVNIMEDKLYDVEALWHDESHLNKYFWLYKPSKLLSPEYCWDPSIGKVGDIHVTRLVWAPKNYDKLRT
ncbi:alpha-1,3-galactosyltransferase 2 [Larimichthys crocea]|uniref:alpha-1,3-galactosyltransferase 2 n=1 Tax=Larimichthys crocea TaxID=215358 RepID=UPI000F5DC7AC|nr:alpha-1,3-galactosyltransferase 2 [Larimichthys crocea]